VAEIVDIEITKPLPEKAVAESTYTIEGSVKMLDTVGALPWVYAEIKRKEWYLPHASKRGLLDRLQA